MKDLADTITRLDAFWKKFGHKLANISCGILILASVLVVVDVFLRFVFRQPIPGATESLAIALPYVAFLSMSYALARGSHVRVTILFDRLPRKIRLWADNFTCLVAIAFLGILVSFGWLHFWESFIVNEEMMAQVFIPAWLGKFAMPLGIFFFFSQYLIRLFLNFGRLAGKITTEEVAEEMIPE